MFQGSSIDAIQKKELVVSDEWLRAAVEVCEEAVSVYSDKERSKICRYNPDNRDVMTEKMRSLIRVNSSLDQRMNRDMWDTYSASQLRLFKGFVDEFKKEC